MMINFLTDRFVCVSVCVCVFVSQTCLQSDLIADGFISSFSIMITSYKVMMIMATCMTGFHIVGTTKSVCLCVDSVYTLMCVCVCLLLCLCHCWLHTDG